MHTHVFRIGATLLTLAVVPWPGLAADIEQRTPQYRAERLIVASDETQVQHYLAFPAILELEDEILVSYKRGRSHADDAGAVLDLVRISKPSSSLSQPLTIAHLDDKIMQMGEWVRFPNGDIANYIDVQQVAGSSRVGLHVVRSTDGGRTFGRIERVGLIDGVEYGYTFDSVMHGKKTWMLTMTFSNLAGGKSVYPPRPHAGSVDIVSTEDNGLTWHFVRNLSNEFGNIPINESTFIRHGNGFLVSSRGYDDRERLHLTDGDFKVLKQTDLTALHPFIRKHIGRPRLFMREGQIYLLGRNYTDRSGPMKLCLFRLDPESLQVNSYSVLDNANEANVTDGYYAGAYFREAGNKTLMNVVTYHRLDRRSPRIIELEYRWDEVR